MSNDPGTVWSLETYLFFYLICWFHCLSVKDRNSLTGIVKLCSKIIGVKQTDLGSFCNQQILRKAECILASPSHVLADKFILLPSGRRYALPMCRTKRFSNSSIYLFILSFISLQWFYRTSLFMFYISYLFFKSDIYYTVHLSSWCVVVVLCTAQNELPLVGLIKLWLIYRLIGTRMIMDVFQRVGTVAVL